MQTAPKGGIADPKTMDINYALEGIAIVERAAIAAARWNGRGNKHAADDAATEAMRKAFGFVRMKGTVVIGEGEQDKAPMLYIGEELGTWEPNAPRIDIAVDPLDGTNLCAQNLPGAVAVIAFADNGGFLNAPDMYMHKLCSGEAGKGVIDIRRTLTWNLRALAEAKRAKIEELTVVLLDRPRHAHLVREVHAAGARIHHITDGDVMAAIATANPKTDIDLLVGSGGGPEGVIAAAALRCYGGEMQAILAPELHDASEREALIARATSMTGRPIDHVYALDELAGGNVMFAATGVTDGPLLRGVRFSKDGTEAETHSIVTRSKTRNRRIMDGFHYMSFIDDD